MLEKRVKSRFSHRQIYHFPPAKFGDFLELAKDSLRLSLQLGDSAAYSRFVEKFNSSIEVADVRSIDKGRNLTPLNRIYSRTETLQQLFDESLTSQETFGCFTNYV